MTTSKPIELWFSPIEQSLIEFLEANVEGGTESEWRYPNILFEGMTHSRHFIFLEDIYAEVEYDAARNFDNKPLVVTLDAEVTKSGKEETFIVELPVEDIIDEDGADD
jgi:hypothetical protein